MKQLLNKKMTCIRHTIFLFMLALTIIILNSCVSLNYPLKYQKKFAAFSFDNKIPHKYINNNNIDCYSSSFLRYRCVYENTYDYILINNFNCKLKKKSEGVFDIYIDDIFIKNLRICAIRFNSEYNKFIINGVDTTSRKKKNIYYDGTDYVIISNNYEYRFLGDSLIYIQTNRSCGWGIFSIEPLAIFKWNKNNSIDSDTLFILPNQQGFLSNCLPIHFNTFNNKWIFEWIGKVYVNGEFINSKYGNHNIYHYTYLDDKEFFFTKHSIHYDKKNIGALGFRKIIPLVTPKDRISFLGKRGFVYYKVSIVGENKKRNKITKTNSDKTSVEETLKINISTINTPCECIDTYFRVYKRILKLYKENNRTNRKLEKIEYGLKYEKAEAKINLIRSESEILENILEDIENVCYHYDEEDVVRCRKSKRLLKIIQKLDL